MAYTITCECGRPLTVQASEAGSQKACSCGRQVSVPSLGKLARATGKPVPTLSAAESVRVLVAAGELPAGTTCVRCQFPTSEVLECSVECERPYIKQRTFWESVLMYMLAPLWLSIIARHYYDEPEVFGRETIVKMPLRMCSNCQALFVGRARASELREALCTVPAYAELLATYPGASVAVVEKTGSGAP
jgi:hypothetical protein